jgi:hypothetical protein
MSRPWCVNNNAALILRLSNDLEFRKENDLGKGARATRRSLMGRLFGLLRLITGLHRCASKDEIPCFGSPHAYVW